MLAMFWLVWVRCIYQYILMDILLRLSYSLQNSNHLAYLHLFVRTDFGLRFLHRHSQKEKLLGLQEDKLFYSFSIKISC